MHPYTTPYLQYMYAYPHKTAYRPLDNIDIRPYLQHLARQANHIYIHLPFCQSKCKFCNLFSVSGTNSSFIDAYIDTMERQLVQLNAQPEVQKAKFSSLILGGGTPLLPSVKQLERVFNLVEKYLPVKLNSTYINIETSPTQTSNDKLQLLQQVEINRISIGVQSFIDEELKQLGRVHNTQEARNALAAIGKIDVDELNIDLIYGIPAQTLASACYSVQEAVKYSPHEIFIYPLYMKAGTAIFSKVSSYEDKRPEMYFAIREILLSTGYRQTSMRRFVRGEQHGISCGFDNTIALGCGGRTYLGNLHFCEPFSVNPQQCKATINSYIQKQDFLYATNGYVISQNEQKRRFAIKNLLFYTGIDTSEYYRLFGSQLLEDFPFLNELIANGYAVNNNKCITLSSQGLALSDYIGPMFISEEVQQKMNEYKL